MEYKVSPAMAEDASEIFRLAKGFDLDVEELSWDQFQVVRKEGALIGIGRLRKYPDCTEVATVGVIQPERHKGVGSALVKELIRLGPPEIFVTCVIPGFFSPLGFKEVKQYPPVLRKKVDFCKLYNFKEEEIFVMKLVK